MPPLRRPSSTSSTLAIVSVENGNLSPSSPSSPPSSSSSSAPKDIKTPKDGCQISIKGWKPFMSVKFFVFIQGLNEFSMIMFFAYSKAIVSQVEKQFSLSASTLGFIDTANDWPTVVLGIFVAFLGPYVHRPRACAIGMMVAALGAVVMFLPHYVRPPYQYDGKLEMQNSTLKWTDSCRDTADITKTNSCDVSAAAVDAAATAAESRSWYFLLVGNVVFGLGTAAIGPFSISYIDDAANPLNTPVYLGVLFTIAIFGPAVGFVLGSVTSKYWVEFDREETPMSKDDPRWVGAWWLGYVVIGALNILFAIPLLFFPKNLPEEEIIGEKHTEDVDAVDDGSVSLGKEKKKGDVVLMEYVKRFIAQGKALSKNWLFVTLMISNCVGTAALAGTVVFLGKYMENQFFVSPGVSNMLRGLVEIPLVCVAIFLGGYLMKRFTMSDRTAMTFSIACEVISVLLGIAFFFVTCESPSTAGVNAAYPPTINPNQQSSRPNIDLPTILRPFTNIPPNTVPPSSAFPLCNADCHCDAESAYNPVCGADGVTYLSPCLAGCRGFELSPDKNASSTTGASGADVVAFTDCACVESNLAMLVGRSKKPKAISGKCTSQCDEKLKVFFAILSLSAFIASLGGTPHYLVFLHSVSKDVKSLAIGVRNSTRKLFGWMTAPLFVGAAIDSACRSWTSNCNKRGFCRVYDNADYANKFWGLMGGLRVLLVLSLSIVWLLVSKRDSKRHEEYKLGNLQNVVKS